MNERIKQITGQVLDELVPDTWTTLGYDKIKQIQYRTAELIVRECAKVAWCHTPDTEELEYSHLIEDKILKHFGVQE
jgi:hypothetical protein